MVVVNQNLRENPALQRMPTTPQEWVHYQNEMAKWVLNVAKLGDGSLTTSGGTTIDGLGEMPGIVPSEQSLPMVTTGNLSSVQDTASAITASDGGGTATITIAAHGLDTSTGLISYNAGTITGLAFETLYFVYAVDASYAGGAVTYLASTDSTDLVTSVGTYYVGQVTTGVAEIQGNISGITKGSPTTFTTSSAHGFTTGFTIDIADIVDNLPGGDIESTFNGNSYTCTVTDTTNFTVAVDSSSLVNTWASGGTATRASTAPPGGHGGGGGKYEP
jgi:hypothetical protein